MGEIENHKENFPSLPFKHEFGLPPEKAINLTQIHKATGLQSITSHHKSLV